jgi:hypothetical protein
VGAGGLELLGRGGAGDDAGPKQLAELDRREPDAARGAEHDEDGTARERIAVPVKRLARVPEAVSDGIAAGLSITYGTTLHALRDLARIRPGETLVVSTAASPTPPEAPSTTRVSPGRMRARSRSA